MSDITYSKVSQSLLTYDSAYGVSQVDFASLDQFLHANMLIVGIYAFRVGLAVTCIPTTILFSNNKKSIIFGLNVACLVFLLLDSVLNICAIEGVYDTVTYSFTGYALFDQHDSAIYTAAASIHAFFIGLIELSMVCQVHVVLASPKERARKLGWVATGFSALLGTITTALYITLAVYDGLLEFYKIDAIYTWLANAPLICFTISTCITSLLLVIKLGEAIKMRRELGLRQFSIFHVLFIMAFQTMIVPVVLILVSFYGDHSDNGPFSIAAIGVALVAVSLPMTTMWANAITNKSIPSSTNNNYLKAINNASYKDCESITSSQRTLTSTLNDEKFTDSPNTASTDSTKFNTGLTPDSEDPQIWDRVKLYADERQVEDSQ